MNNIEVKILNPEAVADAEKIMVCAARLTQRGPQIKNLADFMALYERNYTQELVEDMTKLPHPTIQKFGAINAVVVGASRRFLAQITRHQNEVKFMSASLQYSNYRDEADFVVPYEIMEAGETAIRMYVNACNDAMDAYIDITDMGIDHDAAGYAAPQSLRNVLIICATPFQWKHMIGQRICRRNTAETRYVMLRIWEQLYALNSTMFSMNTTGAFCLQDRCKEGSMSCRESFEAYHAEQFSPTLILKEDFPLLTGKS